MRRRIIVVLTLTLVLIAAVAGLTVYSSSPGFCISCHNMKPYYATWHASKHNKISCVKCHFEPGLAGTIRGKFEAISLVARYVTDTYSPKPFAHIEDASCLQPGCHIKEKLGKTKPFSGKAAFDHAPHFKEGLQSDLMCTSCHSPVKSDKHISVNKQHCYLCHLRDASAQTPSGTLPDDECVVCHTSFPDVIERDGRAIIHTEIKEQKINCRECHSHVVRGDGRVTENRCYNCHDFTENIATQEEIAKVHSTHVTQSVECFLCHEEIVHKATPMEKGAGFDCKACHQKKHSASSTLYNGRGGVGVENHPGVMAQAGVDCAGCHGDGGGDGIKKRCVECHNGEERYADILEKWRTTMGEREKTARELFDRATKTVTDNASPEEKNLLEDARHNLFLVEEGHGEHNMGYSLALLDVAKKNCKKLLGLPNDKSEAEATSRRSVFWFEETEGIEPVRFDHKLHRNKVRGCKNCHDKLFVMERGGTDLLGSLTMGAIYRGKFCGACHDGTRAQDAKEKCDYCHVKKG